MELVEGIAVVDDVDAFVAVLGDVGQRHGVTVQAFDARAIVDERHLTRAVELADRAFERGENVARDRGVEIMLYAAGRRQIDQALAIGVSAGDCPVVVLVDGDGDETAAVADVRDLLDREESTLGEFDADRVRAFFDVSDGELDAVEGTLADVVHERVALLTVER